jgi:NAD(P)-dependent dehydrogenase (short-subunit alcohol dehydrogenase family)
MTEGLKGQVAIITGASRGIGLAIAQALAAQDVAVALVGRSEATLQAASETIRKMGGQAIPSAQTSLTNKPLIRWWRKRFGDWGQLIY